MSFISGNLSVATVSGSTLTIVGVGTADITASQTGNGDFDAATPVVRTLSVSGTPEVPATGAFAHAALVAIFAAIGAARATRRRLKRNGVA